MAEMAPALTDTAAHSDTFKLPASPANPGCDSLYSLSSPNLPDQLLPTTKFTPVLSTKQPLPDDFQTLGRIVSASVPKSEFVKSKNGLNGHSHGYIHLENLTQLMKSKDAKSVIELLSGLNGTRTGHRDSASLRSMMNGSDPDLSEKVESASLRNAVSFPGNLNSLSDEQIPRNPSLNLGQSGEAVVSNDPDPFMVAQNNDDAVSNMCTGLGEDVSIDSELSLPRDAETPSTNNSCSKDSFSFEEKVLNAAEGLLSGLDESSLPKASTFDECTVEVPEFRSARLEDALSRQETLRDRSNRLVDRLRKLQFAQVGLHTKDEIRWFASQVHKDTSKPNGSSKNGCLACKQRKQCNTESFTPCDKHANNGSPSGKHALSTLEQRITNGGECKVVSRNIEKVHRRLQSDLSHLKEQVDSDATDGSSDESDEESEFKLTYHRGPNKGYNRLSLNRRAIWKWAQHRAGVARRWTWLQAQVSDLEYRIRQHSDIYRQIKSAKGSVTLETRPSTSQEQLQRSGSRSGRKLPLESKDGRLEAGNAVSPVPLSAVLSNVDHQSARLHKSLSNCLSTASGKPALQLNGCVHSRSGDTHNQRTSSPANCLEPLEERYCARTRPVRFYRRRRLVRLGDIAQVSTKARRLSSIRCGCCPPNMCVMCGGRFNKTKLLNAVSMPLAEKVSNLSPGFHPVLSFPNDVPLPVHFESLINRSDNDRGAKVQKRHLKTLTENQKTKKRNQKRLHKLRNAGESPNSLPIGQVFYKKLDYIKNTSKNELHGDVRVLSRSKSDSVSLASSGQGSVTTSEEELRRCRSSAKRRRSQANADRKTPRERSTSLPTLGPPTSSLRMPHDSKPPTPTTQSGFSIPAAAQSHPHKKSHPATDYDIDNIVIPYSMLATTRVEKLRYKEIDTPQWRMIHNGMMDDEEGLSHIPVEEATEEEETLSDTEYSERHLRYEINEKKKFLAILANQGAAAIAAGRRSRRTRNNSTASTPDPLSPSLPSSAENYSLPGSFDATSPLSPSPLLPLREDLAGTPAAVEPVVPRRLRSCSADKKRTLFTSDSKSASLDESEPVHIAGWIARTFPLRDEEVEHMTAEQDAEEAIYSYRSPVSGSAKVATLAIDSEDEDFFGSDQEAEDPNDPEWTVVTQKKRRRLDSQTPTDDDPLIIHLKCAVKKEQDFVSPSEPAPLPPTEVPMEST